MFRNVQNVLQVISGLYSAEFLLSTVRGQQRWWWWLTTNLKKLYAILYLGYIV